MKLKAMQFLAFLMMSVFSLVHADEDIVTRGSVVTGVGSELTVSFFRRKEVSYLFVWYVDKRNYFGRGTRLGGTIKLKTHSLRTGSGPFEDTHQLDLSVYGGDGEGIGTGEHICRIYLDNDVVVDSAEVAVSNNGSAWDSNLGHNYFIPLHP